MTGRIFAIGDIHGCADKLQRLLDRLSIATRRDTLAFLPAEHRDFIASLLPFWETSEYLFVHAGLRPGLPLAKQSLSDLCEIRGQFLEEDVDFGKRVIFGHTPFATLLVTPHKIGIDTGARGGPGRSDRSAA